MRYANLGLILKVREFPQSTRIALITPLLTDRSIIA
jgi:hypothetical protein